MNATMNTTMRQWTCNVHENLMSTAPGTRFQGPILIRNDGKLPWSNKCERGSNNFTILFLILSNSDKPGGIELAAFIDHLTENVLTFWKTQNICEKRLIPKIEHNNRVPGTDGQISSKNIWGGHCTIQSEAEKRSIIRCASVIQNVLHLAHHESRTNGVFKKPHRQSE